MAGCGDKKPVRGPTGTVSGKVTLNGKPAPAGCTVVFMQQEKTVPASGVVGADGAYSVSNALVGASKISVSPPAKASAAADPSNPEAYKAVMMGKGGKGSAETKPAIPAKYGSFETSGLTFTVKEGSNSHDIELKE
jgi:hypothetical protein